MTIFAESSNSLPAWMEALFGGAAALAAILSAIKTVYEIIKLRREGRDPKSPESEASKSSVREAVPVVISEKHPVPHTEAIAPSRPNSNKTFPITQPQPPSSPQRSTIPARTPDPSQQPVPGKSPHLTSALFSGLLLVFFLIVVVVIVSNSGDTAPPIPGPVGPGHDFTASNGMEMKWIPSLNYWVGTLPVTSKQFSSVTDSYLGFPDADPAAVNWNDADDYCKKLTDKDHASGLLPTSYKYDLPTDSQYSAFVGEEFLSMNAATGANPNTDFTSAVPVGQNRPNEFGLYNTQDDVWEWCSDWYTDAINQENSEKKDADVGTTHKVYRGGSWNEHHLQHLNIHYRGTALPDTDQGDIGFRCVVVP